MLQLSLIALAGLDSQTEGNLKSSAYRPVPPTTGNDVTPN